MEFIFFRPQSSAPYNITEVILAMNILKKSYKEYKTAYTRRKHTQKHPFCFNKYSI